MMDLHLTGPSPPGQTTHQLQEGCLGNTWTKVIFVCARNQKVFMAAGSFYALLDILNGFVHSFQLVIVSLYRVIFVFYFERLCFRNARSFFFKTSQ